MSYGLRQAYDRLAKLGDPLAEVNTLLDWEKFRTIAERLYDNKTERGGPPNIDCVQMIKILVLQQWHSLSDQRMERELASNVSFMNFLGFQEIIPDSSTIWLFRERLKEKGKINAIWQELQSQLDAKGLVVKEGSIQDATFITSDPGKPGNESRDENARTRRSKDGTWTKKGDEFFFGYKLHNKVDVQFGLIRAIETTTASVHDSQVDLSTEDERVYRDKGYFGASARGRVCDYVQSYKRPSTKRMGQNAKLTDQQDKSTWRETICSIADLSSARVSTMSKHNQNRLQSRSCGCNHNSTSQYQDGIYRYCL
jgi:IS5 family transposase